MKHILLVEDDEAIRDSFMIILGESYYQLHSIESGDAILRELVTPPDLFILDKQISRTDGLEICRFIKQSRKYGNVPVLMLSANPAIVELAAAAGADGAIKKPFSLKQIRDAIAQFVFA